MKGLILIDKFKDIPLMYHEFLIHLKLIYTFGSVGFFMDCEGNHKNIPILNLDRFITYNIFNNNCLIVKLELDDRPENSMFEYIVSDIIYNTTKQKKINAIQY